VANNKKDLKALRRMISQAELVLDTIPAHPSVNRAKELLNVAGKLADDLATVNPAVALGAKGGTKTAERGPEYFKQIAAMRKTKAGGRPRKVAPEPTAQDDSADVTSMFVKSLNANVLASGKKNRQKD
jgi:hypothetical protein